MDFETYLIENGYDTTSVGGVMFSFLFEDVLYLMENGFSNDEIKEELKSIYSDYIYRYFRVEGSVFFNEIINFLKTKKGLKSNNVGRVDDALIRLGKKFRKDNNLNKVKRKVKTKSR